MDLIVYDNSFNPLGLIDIYDSLIWTERLYSSGDFELSLAPTTELFSILQKNYYIWNPEATETVSSSDIRRKMMIIEGLEIQTDAEDGNKLVVTGRSLESILDRRIVWKQTEIDSYLQTAVQRLLNENVISPTSDTGGTNRQISNFIFETSTDSYITSLRLSAQYTGDNLYDVICQICKDNEIGFRINMNDSNQFCFKLFAGKDMSYSQTENPYVCFSPSYENIISSNYQTNISALKNITHIGGEGEGSDRTFSDYYSGNEPTGLDRRELFTDARDLSTKSYDSSGTEITLTDEEYQAILKERGAEDLLTCKEVKEFESEIDATQQYKLGEDFNLGDYVQIVNEYGIEGKALITEVVTSLDDSGKSFYPAFVLVDTFDDIYDELEYIQSSGTQYIQTDFTPTSADTITASVEFTTIGSNHAVWCTRGATTSTNTYSLFAIANSGWRLDYSTSSTGTVTGTTVINTRYSIIAESGDLTINGSKIVDGSYQSITFNDPLTLMASFENGKGQNLSNYMIGKYYSFCITRSGVTVLDYIPVKRKADNKPGLYDKVSRKFFVNKGTGEFTYG